jgi:NTP pyrophosphatase (non-canonical NTP hydrolase)
MKLQETDTNGVIMEVADYQIAAHSVEIITAMCHGLSNAAGWWPSDKTTRNVPEALCLIHSEISEALEGARKDKKDEHLPHHKSLTVELADAIIRICDLAGGLNLPLGEALAEKLCYNQIRLDHKLSERAKEGGKKF